MSKILLFLSNTKFIAKEKVKTFLNYKHRLLLAEPSYHDDLYVVAYPKSGITWMNFLMANIHLIMSGKQRNVNFFNVHNFIPDIHFSRQVRQEALPFPGVRVMKSHSSFNPYYKNVIYLVRDPRDVMVSYYHFLHGLGEFEGVLSELIRCNNNGITAWVDHVSGWLSRSSASVPFFVVRYEDLKNDTACAVDRIYKFMGYNIPDDIIQRAVLSSSFEKMKLLENELSNGGRQIGNNFRFMRKGESGTWAGEISKDDEKYILQVAGPVMSQFEYF